MYYLNIYKFIQQHALNLQMTHSTSLRFSISHIKYAYTKDRQVFRSGPNVSEV